MEIMRKFINQFGVQVMLVFLGDGLGFIFYLGTSRVATDGVPISRMRDFTVCLNVFQNKGCVYVGRTVFVHLHMFLHSLQCM